MSDIIEKARDLRKRIEASAQHLPDDQIAENVQLFPKWNDGGACYLVGEKVAYNGKIYKVLTAHTSQSAWKPSDSPSLFAPVLTDPEKALPWQQPDSTNPYMAGDKVIHNDKIWVSDIDNNVWEPGAYGWSEISV